jgi:hypothetical protein
MPWGALSGHAVESRLVQARPHAQGRGLADITRHTPGWRADTDAEDTPFARGE